jgi:hypothetical protein
MMSHQPTFPRILGLLTLGYGAYTLARPDSLVHAAGLEARGGGVSRSGRTLGRVIGARDVLSGTAMMLAPDGPLLRAAILARTACDGSDVVGFGLSVPGTSRAKVVSIAAGWGALCASSLLATGRTR